MRYRPIGIVLAALLLSGCGFLSEYNERAETIVNTIVKAAELVSDKAMDSLDETVAFLERKAQRANKARCKWPHTALIRYVRRGEAEAARVAKHCNLVVNDIEATVTVKPAE